MARQVMTFARGETIQVELDATSGDESAVTEVTMKLRKLFTGQWTLETTAPVASEQRAHMIGIERHSLHLGAGHVFTQRAHHCGDFKDDFDWSRLPLAYRVRIGAPMHKEPTP